MLSRAAIALMFSVLAATLAVAPRDSGAGRVLSLAGEWRFALDRADDGIKGRWFQRNLTDRIKLPGALQERGYGDEVSPTTEWNSHASAMGDDSARSPGAVYMQEDAVPVSPGAGRPVGNLLDGNPATSWLRPQAARVSRMRPQSNSPARCVSPGSAVCRHRTATMERLGNMPFW